MLYVCCPNQEAPYLDLLCIVSRYGTWPHTKCTMSEYPRQHHWVALETGMCRDTRVWDTGGHD
jgi:hypothetical protein